MKREIFLQRVRKGLQQHLNFKGKLFARKTEEEKGEITSGGERGWRGSPTAPGLAGDVPRAQGLCNKPQLPPAAPALHAPIPLSCPPVVCQGTGTPGDES